MLSLRLRYFGRRKEGENMPISRLYGAAAPRFSREIKQSEYWDRAAIDTPPGPFETTGGFVWTGSGEP